MANLLVFFGHLANCTLGDSIEDVSNIDYVAGKSGGQRPDEGR